MKNIFCIISTLMLAVYGFENCKITPYTLLELAFKGNAEPMVLASPAWESFSEVPCQYFFNEGFYNMFDVFNINNPVLLVSNAQTNPDTEPTVYFNFCQSLKTAANFNALNCPDASALGDLYAMSVSTSDPPVCTPLSTSSLTSITNSTWINEADNN